MANCIYNSKLNIFLIENNYIIGRKIACQGGHQSATTPPPPGLSLSL